MKYTVLSYAYQSGQNLQAVDFEIWISACINFHCAREKEHKVGTTNFGKEISKCAGNSSAKKSHKHNKISEKASKQAAEKH